MVHRAACRLAGQVSAVAVLQAPLRGPCRPSRPVSVLQLAGTADDVLPYGGGPTPEGFDAPPMRAAMARWRRLDRCGHVWRRVAGRAVRERARCAGGTVAELVTVRGAGHDWYGARDGVDATQAILAFFAER
ncbi:MAG TPA: hypothetical protein VF533_19005 [Solirubrobacteraceae bacterium]|jgi:polyhydroxybutyrate depolymerase